MENADSELLKESTSKFINRALPRVGITIGDAAGIGTEIVLKSLLEKDIFGRCLPILIGDARLIKDHAARFNFEFDFLTIEKGFPIPSSSEAPVIYDLANIDDEIAFGVETELTGRASADNIKTAVELCLSNEIDAISTAPISKRALRMANIGFPGHTEFLAHLTHTQEFAMSFFAGNLRVVLLSTHVSLREAIKRVKKNALVELIRLTDRELFRLLKKKPKIAIAGLNPHASEGGLFGSEETEEMFPAMHECIEEYSIDVRGIFSADTVFLRCARGEFDVVITCYHDQATIPIKSISFGEGINVTLGLPIIRTSVDHGTAFDIAGKNIAGHSSMKAAILLAAQLCRN